MWKFEGVYTGEAKKYIKKKQKKVLIIADLLISVFCLLIFGGMAIELCKGNQILLTIVLSIGGGFIALINLVLFIYYMLKPKCVIEINNYSIQVFDGETCHSITFYRIKTIEVYDDFIIIKDSSNLRGYVLQKELLIDGEWEDLKAFLKEVEDSLDSEDPVYQVKEPKTEFFEATVKSKRVCKRFDGDIYTPHTVYEYLVTFYFENGKEFEYEIGQESYERVELGEIGTLVLINGNFFSFGTGENIE